MEIMKFFFHKITVTGELTVAAIIFEYLFLFVLEEFLEQKEE